jgi:transcriptional regulator with XRE-family HTH domain
MENYLTVEYIEDIASDMGVKVNKVLAECKVSRSTYWRWKQGKTEPFQSTLRLIHDTLQGMK